MGKLVLEGMPYKDKLMVKCIGFRPEKNFARELKSAKDLAMPEITEQCFSVV